MTTKPITIILGIVHSKLAQNIAPQLLDESLANSVAPALDKIKEGIQVLKIKDLKLSQDQLSFIMIRLKNKYAKKKGCSEKTNETLSQEIDADLKSTQLSAMSGLNSGLGSVEKVDCIKIILMTECFMVLNALSSLKEIKPHEKDIFVAKLANAEQSCNMKLRQLNDIMEVRDFLTKKLMPGTVKKLTMDSQRFGIGIDKAKLTRDVITINIYVGMFFHHFRAKIAAYEAEEAAKTKKKKKKRNDEENDEDDDGIAGMIGFGGEIAGMVGFGGDLSASSCDYGTALLLNEDVLCIGAAYSVVTKDDKLAQHVENFMLRFDDIKERTAEMSKVKDYLRNNTSVQMVVKRNRKPKKGEVKSDDIKEHHGAPLKYLHMLSAMQSMSDYVVETAKEKKPKLKLRFRKKKDRDSVVKEREPVAPSLLRAVAFVGRLRARMMLRRRMLSVETVQSTTVAADLPNET